tara:strand:+ start:406 stop:552 length:147 start_codon:yes stop_codon:yes gene_type:complete
MTFDSQSFEKSMRRLKKKMKKLKKSVQKSKWILKGMNIAIEGRLKKYD